MNGSSPARPLLAVVVVNYGSSSLLESTLVNSVGDFRRASTTALDVIVVDNFSSLEERRQFEDLCRRERFVAVAADENLGFGAGMNLGVERAISLGADAMLLLNPDAWIDPASVQALSAHVRDHPLQIAAPVIRRPDGSVWSAEMDVYRQTGQVRASRFRPAAIGQADSDAWVSGACMMLGRDLWQRIGGFDNDYFMYWEDIDLCRRAAALGGGVVVVADATAVHDESGTQDRKGLTRSALFYFYNTRNRLVFAKKHLPPNIQHRWRRASFANARRLLRAEGKRLLTRPLTTILPVVRGELAGRRFMRRARSQR